MVTAKLPPMAYLMLRNKVGYAFRIKVPESLSHLYLTSGGKPRTHIIKGLSTRDHSVAVRKRAVLLKQWRETFDRQMQELGIGPEVDGGKVGDVNSNDHREDLIAARRDPTVSDDALDLLETVTLDAAERIEEKDGPDKARAWYRAVTAEGPWFKDEFRKYVAQSDLGAVSKIKHEQSIKLFTRWLRDAGHTPGNDILLSALTPKIGREFARYLSTEARTNRGTPMSIPTRRSYLAPLSSACGYLIENELLPSGVNPFRGAGVKVGKVSSTDRAAAEAKKRPYQPEELVALFSVPEKRTAVGMSYPMSLLVEVHAILLLTGARAGEICNLVAKNVTTIKEGVNVTIMTSKTTAGQRVIPIVHPLAVSLLRDRRKAAMKVGGPDAPLFPELEPGGPTNSRAERLIDAAGKLRDKAGLPSCVDLHSLRRNFMSQVVSAGAIIVHGQFYWGHTVRGVLQSYLFPTQDDLLKVARLVTLDPAVEKALRKHLR
jgi:integrase